MADEKEKTQTRAAGAGRQAGQAGAHAAQAGRQAGRRSQGHGRQVRRHKAKAAGAKPPTPALRPRRPKSRRPPRLPPKRRPPAAKPARRRAKPAATSDSAPATEAADTGASAKPARKRAAAARSPPRPCRPSSRRRGQARASRAAKAKPRRAAGCVHRAPEERTATVVDAAGKRVDEVKLSVDRFGVATDINLLHLAVRAEQAARRRGTASTRTRGEVSGSTAKLYRQKGTGRARAGSVKSPTRSGGGTAFGPKPRSYELKINRKAARKALAMALSDRAEGGTVYVARGLELEAPSTATVDELLVALDIAAPVLVVTDDEPVIEKSVRNLRYAEAGEARRLSVEQVLRNRSIVVTEKAFSVLTGA